MKRRWTVAVTGVLAVTVALTATACGGGDENATAKEATGFVALGDSYAAGLGAGNYGDRKDCKQSKDGGYPQLWLKLRTAAKFGVVTDATCAGAKINDVRFKQLGKLDDSTGWVTLTVGGNDAGWSGTLQQCLLGSDETCKASVDKAVAAAESTLPGALDELYQMIREQAPNAKVFVLGYPHLVAEPGAGVTCEALNDTRRKSLNEGADSLVELIQGRVAAQPGFTFVDVRKSFAGHEACTKEPWIHSLRDDLSESFHPTAEGHKAYADALFAVTG
ncbi:SGNH/GDSL hydrolase family protein [Actinoplanes sp. NEAU-A12]|uniref:SGNH/GDSL hydrolase family protein n=1 Tax=Actinoplanes sandaracinus TaxID=3045177 RepID=A0ABT6WS44_9ACTN|nr:SGNH/GDSL hydrolase family protein [Actinoplanes sandaracinus]MDI6102563.1 SGNH/GDSL hydrolase family protein [Actinoplanes sandaracinus]